MSDLRERLGRLFACRCDPTWTERQLHAPNCVEELGDDALTEVAEWLDDLAKTWWDRSTNHPWDRARDVATIRAMYLTDLADSLTRS